MLDFNKECAASSDKGSEPVVLCSKMVRIGERQKFCVHGIIGARQTGASNEHEHQTQFS